MPTDAHRAAWNQLVMLPTPTWTDSLPLAHQNVLADALRAHAELLSTAVVLGSPGEHRDEALGRLYLAETLLTDLEANR